MTSEPMFAVDTGGVGGGGMYDSGEASPESTVKFLCSHGGRILHRPTDGKLKYIGGETRVIAVSRDVCFADLMRKLTELFPGEMVLKYQMLPEDLDALVSVRSDEDLKHMMEEYNRRENKGTSRLRAFLFPAKPMPVESHALEQRYIDAINGNIICTPSTKSSWVSTYKARAFSSTSPDSHSVNPFNRDSMQPNGYQNNNSSNLGAAHESTASNGLKRNKFGMSRVQSSPTLCNLSTSQYSGLNHPQLYSLSHNQNYQHGSGSASGSNQYPPGRVVAPTMQHSGGSMERPEMGKFYEVQEPNYSYPSSTPPPRRQGSGGGGKNFDDSSCSLKPPKRYGSGGFGYYDDSSCSVMPEMPSRGLSPGPVPEMPSRSPGHPPPKRYGSGSGIKYNDDTSYNVMAEVPRRVRSPSPRLDSPYGGMLEIPSRGHSPNPRLDSPNARMPEIPSRGHSPSPRLNSPYVRMPEMQSHGRSPGSRLE